MKSTALGAENIIFISDAHEKFYYEKLQEVRYQDVYHKALCYCLGINGDTRKNADRIYNFKTGSVKTKCLHEGWQTSGSLKVVRMAFNLYCNSTPTFDGDVYVENIRCFLDISREELEKRKCTVNEQDITALIFSQKHLEALYLQCLMHRRNAMQEVPELKGLSETCNRIYKLQDVDVLFQCLLMDQMDWEEGKLYVQFSTVYLLLSLRNK